MRRSKSYIKSVQAQVATIREDIDMIKLGTSKIEQEIGDLQTVAGGCEFQNGSYGSSPAPVVPLRADRKCLCRVSAQLDPIDNFLCRWLKRDTEEYDAEIASEVGDFPVKKLEQPIVGGACVVLPYERHDMEK